MSVQTRLKRLTLRDIAARKGAEPVVVLTAYTAPIAKLFDPHVDILLVGDSLANVVYGMETTLGVDLDTMIRHGQAVMRGSQRAMVVIDLPFGTYQESREQAYRTSARVMAETGCSAVKLEGGKEMAQTVRFLTERGIPVMGHVGLKPQSVHADGGFRAHGRDEAEAQRVIEDAVAIDGAGAFSIVVEGTVEPLAARVSKEIACPTIGIGASAACDGQVLVADDMLGLFTDYTPKFVKKFADLAPLVEQAAKDYAAEVRARSFPGPEHTFGAKK